MRCKDDEDDKEASFRNFLDAVRRLIPHLKEATIRDADEYEKFRRRIESELPDGQREIFNSLVEGYRRGWPLALVFQNTLDILLDRKDLDKADKEEALADAEEFWTLFDGLQEASDVPRELVFQLTTLGLLTALRAGLSPDQVRKLRERLPAELGREGGKKSGALRRSNRPWVAHASELAKEACLREPNLSNEKIAASISDYWKHSDPQCPGMRTLTSLVSELRAAGQLPQRTGSLRK